MRSTLETPGGAPDFEVVEFFPKRTKYCVCVTVLNEGDRLRNQLNRMKDRAGLADIIIADGRSSDDSTAPEFLKESGTRALLMTSEPGLSTATRMGMAYAMAQGYEGMITIDGNGKDGVEALPDFIRELDHGYDLVQGSRFLKGGRHKNTPWDRYLGIRLVMAPLLGLTCGFHYTDPTDAFRAMSRRFLCDPRVQPLRPIFVRFSLQHYVIYRAAKLGFKVKEIPVTRVYPEDGSVPTKIHGLRLKLVDLLELIAAVSGRYDPR
jgi:glycosyltransferase involved in cell wall biosynthesis